MTGDLLKSIGGYYYFVDRIGDTFRWKGENVATSEVEAVLRAFPGVQDVNVYGVQIPGQSGRAGMAAIVGSNLDLRALYKHCNEQLPPYAVPVFLRIRKELAVTGTFKHQKGDLQTEGFNPNIIKDPLFTKSTSERTYIPLDPPLFGQLCADSPSKL